MKKVRGMWKMRRLFTQCEWQRCEATQEQYATWVENFFYLAVYLKNGVSNDHFNQSSFYEHRGEHRVPRALITYDCQTSACSWGHAAVMPHFNKQGLKFELTRDGKWRINNYPAASNFGYKLFGVRDDTKSFFFGGARRNRLQQAALLEDWGHLLLNESVEKGLYA